eukprot:2456978-Prymnesium_polylepis.1
MRQSRERHRVSGKVGVIKGGSLVNTDQGVFDGVIIIPFCRSLSLGARTNPAPANPAAWHGRAPSSANGDCRQPPEGAGISNFCLLGSPERALARRVHKSDVGRRVRVRARRGGTG